MDFHNIAHALGKQTKKVKDMASKPIDLVATPISNLHKKIKKTVF
ncbi:MAG: hypothetical protein Q8O99_02475 [bacterium]|nr:hypothetical protein [bacterium]